MSHGTKKTKKTPAIVRGIKFLLSARGPVLASVFLMGLGQLMYKQIIKGILYIVAFAGLCYYFITRGFKDIAGFFTLGTQEENTWLGIPGDNSMNMMIIGIFSIIVLIFTIVLWIVNLKDVAETQKRVAAGKKPLSFKETIASYMDEKFYALALVLPIIGVCIFSILPIVFMILLAFTNFGGNVVHPVLADWSVSAWTKIFALGDIGATFKKILGWNLTWAVLSTMVNYAGGLGLALLLNKKNVRGSKFWRSFPILAYAVPGFISMLGFKYMFSQSGPINYFISQAGYQKIFFLINDASAKWWARGIGLFVNAWISIPSIMLLATGILSNINNDLYEAASIDGATAAQKFKKITLPFVIFSTTPYLIGNFTGNFNNFGIFFFLRGGTYSNGYFLASDTDLLINWLYNLSVSNKYYSVGAVISLIIFMITSVISLIVYVNSSAYKREDTFQ